LQSGYADAQKVAGYVAAIQKKNHCIRQSHSQVLILGVGSQQFERQPFFLRFPLGG